jgi:hypothetical protein
MMGRVESLAAHRNFAGSTAWAQADDADVDSPTLVIVPDISGSYSGPVDDHRFGAGTLAASITQIGSEVSGNWETNLNGGFGGTLTGKVKPNSKVKLTLMISGHCGLLAQGRFMNGDEIKGKYHTIGCGHPSHGTFDILD